MALMEPFRALRAAPEHASRVAAPPYDVLDAEEARVLAAGNPDSFLYVSKPEIDFAPGTDPHGQEVYERGRSRLQDLIARGRLVRDPAPGFYLYRVLMGEHSQLGLVGTAAVADYRAGRIKRHEHTNPGKVEDRARNADALDAHTGTLFLTHRSEAALDERMARLAAVAPDLDVVAEDGVRHSIWMVSDTAEIEAFQTGFESLPAVYIADGHHRSAAADRLHTWRQAAIREGAAVGPADRFLAVSFPDDQVKILPYNRVVTTLGDRSAAEFLDALQRNFRVAPSAQPVEPDIPGDFGLYVDGGWYRLTVVAGSVGKDPLGRLDINVLSAYCLAPLLGISDQRTDPRIDFVGGIRGVAELERRVDCGEMAAAFALHATRLADVLAVADAGEVMPTKSTWFEPKLRDGLLVLPLS